MKSKTFRKYLFIVLLCMIVPMMIVLGITYTAMREEIIRQTEATEKQRLIKCSNAFDDSLDAIRDISAKLLSEYGTDEEGRGFFGLGLDEQLRFLNDQSITQNNEYIKSYYVLFDGSKRYIKNGVFLESPYSDDQEFFKYDEIVNNKACYVWKAQREIHQRGVGTSKVVTLIRSFPIGAKVPRGFVAINVDFDALLKPIILGDSRKFHILDKSGSCDYTYGSNGKAEGGLLTYKRDSQVLDWNYEITLSKQVLLSPLVTIKKWFLGIIIIGVIGCLIISFITSRNFYNPVKEILKNIKNEKKKTYENEFALIKEQFIQAEQKENRWNETYKKFRPIYYENIVRILLLSSNIEKTGLVPEELFIGSAKKYCIAVFNDYQKEAGDGLGLWAEIKRILRQTMDSTYKYVGTLMQASVVAVIFYTDDGNIPIYDSVLSLVRIIKKQVESERKLELSAGVTGEIDTYAGLQEAYTDALRASTYHVYFENDKVIETRIIRRNKPDDSYSYNYPKNLDEPIFEALKNKNKEELRKKTDAFFREISDRRLPPDVLQLWVNTLYISADSLTERMGIQVGKQSIEMGALPFDIRGYRTILEIRDIFEAYCFKILDVLERDTTDRHQELIESVKKYTLENISDAISLAAIADHYSISVPYLSGIFKQETGENFVKYLIRVKMDFASKLLIETKISIGEIATRTGYTNLNSFSSSFKKYFGKTPSQFRFSNLK